MAEAHEKTLLERLGLFDSTMIVAGAMIGSGIFIVSADIARQVGAPGWLLLTWVITGLLTVAVALSYGELAAMMPKAGGQYVFLREASSPFWGFLYGWTLFLVIQSGTIAAVGVAFARFLGVLVPAISPTAWIVAPINLSHDYALSLSWQQLVGLSSVAFLTWLNTRGLETGRIIQDVFTSAKILALAALVLGGILVARNAEAVAANFGDWFGPRGVSTIRPDFSFLPAVTAQSGVFGLLVALAVAQVGSLFAADAWNNVTFIAGEVKDARRTLPMALILGTGLVVTLYVLANVAYLNVLPLDRIQNAPDDRVGTAALEALFGDWGAVLMAAAIVISAFGCNNGLILAGARVLYAMARDGLFFAKAGLLNRHKVPAWALWAQGLWSVILILPRTRQWRADSSPVLDPTSGMQRYGNLYGDLLDYIVSSVLIFYILTMIGLFRLRKTQPDALRPYRAWGYPWVQALYIAAAGAIAITLFVYKTQTTWPGLAIVLSGVPVYFLWRRFAGKAGPVEDRA
jgi:basic amino acid/polyamine antiporter, APA family